jgi:hypothetical protein
MTLLMITSLTPIRRILSAVFGLQRAGGEGADAGGAGNDVGTGMNQNIASGGEAAAEIDGFGGGDSNV